ncbi:hypothetical protein BJX64DRAFT_253987 [Aspergillus heterothallicus]
MPCNVISNPSFEAGLESWTASGPATVVTSPIAYAGESFLSLETTPTASTNTVTQDLYWLDTDNVHNLTVQVRVAGEIPSTSHCEVRALIGGEEFASDIIWTGDEWVTLTGSFQPAVRDTTFSLVGYCSFAGGEGDGEYFDVYFDDVVIDDC